LFHGSEVVGRLYKHLAIGEYNLPFDFFAPLKLPPKIILTSFFPRAILWNRPAEESSSGSIYDDY